MSFISILRAAKGIRYSTVQGLLGREVAFNDRLAIVTESLSLVNEFFPSTTYVGPEQKYIDGQIAKYGILDLTFSADRSLLHDCASGVPILRELGLVGNDDFYEDRNFDNNDLIEPMSGVRIVLDDLEKSQAYVKLYFKASVRPSSDVRDRMQRIFNPESLQFPMTFDIIDACITNVSSAWIMKYFYL